MSSACACLAGSAIKVDALFAQAAPASSARIFRCGTPPPTPAQRIQNTRVVNALRSARVTFRGKTIIPVRFHIIHQGQQGYISDRQVKKQVEMLNRIYAPAAIAFKIEDIGLHENDFWFTGEPGSDAEIEMKTELGKDTARCLNFYSCEPGGGLLGYATFPWWYQESPQFDGVVVHHASLPYSRANWPYNLGMTAVHEIGHWCGLYHTFQGGCEAPGDDIDDTPYEESAASGCPVRTPSSCPGETRFIPVENYMDYSDDSCMKQFTPMQYTRIKEMVGYYRYQLSPQTSRSALLAQIRASIE
jgi:hypothetical protein